MTGLEKILAQIRSDSDNACADIKNRTDRQCDDIIANAQAQAALIIEAGDEAAKRKSNDIIDRAKSAADLEERSVMLRTKQEIISSALDSAREYLCTLPDEEYFDLILKLSAKYSEDGEGAMHFSQKDLSRLPADFESKLNKTVKGTVTVSKEPVSIDGGFILIYGGIEINCAFSSIFSAENERFSDEVAKLLFA